MNKLKLNNQLNNKSNTKGFTIIEVVLVLAIAGLIFLMVFLALPALQRSQRDTQRKRQADMIIAALNNYTSNNRNRNGIGGLWGHCTSKSDTTNVICALVDKGYLKEEEMLDPSTGQLYELDHNASGGRLYTNYKNIEPGYYGIDSGYCNGNIPTDSWGMGSGVENSNFVFVIGLEGGGNYCVSNKMI